MFWIHGGGFLGGQGNDRLYGPEVLLDREVVLVTIQYRIGPLGFWTLGDEAMSGNQGLWDQQLGMHVQYQQGFGITSHQSVPQKPCSG